jgi:hypothetical protein
MAAEAIRCVRHLAIPPPAVSLMNHSDGRGQVRPIHLLDCLIHNLYKAIVNLQRPRFCVGVTEELNFTREAERLQIAHPLLGYLIRHLVDKPEDGERLTVLHTVGPQA